MTFSKKTKQNEIEIVRTDFKIDRYYTNELKCWLSKLEEFYDKAKIS